MELINIWKGLHIELVGVQKRKFTIKDVYNIFGYMSFSFAMAHKTDPLLTDIRNKYGMEYLKDFGLDGVEHLIKTRRKIQKSFSYFKISAALEQFADSSFYRK
jgi:penicillin amidase